MKNSEHTRSLVQSAIYADEIKQVTRLLNKKKIVYVFLKGLPLHLYYENTVPKRIYVDCDILIDKKNINRAEKIFLFCGYKKMTSSIIERQIGQISVRRKMNYFKIINGVPVVFDLHFEISFMMTQLVGLDELYPQKLINKLTEECLKTKRQMKINNESFQILETRYLILYLALHFFHHNYRGAFRLDFLDKIIRKSKPSSDLINQLIESVVTNRLQNFVYPTFVLLKKYYHTPIPQGFLTKIEPKSPLIRESVNSLIKTNIFDDEPRVKAGINRFKNLFFLSPEPMRKKLFIFFKPQVFSTIFWVFQKGLSSFLSNLK